MSDCQGWELGAEGSGKCGYKNDRRGPPGGGAAQGLDCGGGYMNFLGVKLTEVCTHHTETGHSE